MNVVAGSSSSERHKSLLIMVINTIFVRSDGIVLHRVAKLENETVNGRGFTECPTPRRQLHSVSSSDLSRLSNTQGLCYQIIGKAR